MQPDQSAQRKYPCKLQEVWCMTVPSELEAMLELDEESGKTLEFRQLHFHTKYRYIWITSYAIELGRLCQVIGSRNTGPKQQRVKGTNIFRIIRYEDITLEKRRDICHTRVVCQVRPWKDDTKRTHITVAGKEIYYPVDVASPTGSLELVKFMVNSVLSRPGAFFACFAVNNFTLTHHCKSQNM